MVSSTAISANVSNLNDTFFSTASALPQKAGFKAAYISLAQTDILFDQGLAESNHENPCWFNEELVEEEENEEAQHGALAANSIHIKFLRNSLAFSVFRKTNWSLTVPYYILFHSWKTFIA
jgi:hypothetical protein